MIAVYYRSFLIRHKQWRVRIIHFLKVISWQRLGRLYQVSSIGLFLQTSMHPPIFQNTSGMLESIPASQDKGRETPGTYGPWQEYSTKKWTIFSFLLSWERPWRSQWLNSFSIRHHICGSWSRFWGNLLQWRCTGTALPLVSRPSCTTPSTWSGWLVGLKNPHVKNSYEIGRKSILHSFCCEIFNFRSAFLSVRHKTRI